MFEVQPEVSINKVGSTRVGRVVVSMETIRKNPEMVQKMWAVLIPLTTIYVARVDSIEYLCVSELFDELESGEMIPMYRSQIHSDGSTTFQRISFKKKISDSVNSEIVRVIMNEKIDLEVFKAYCRKFTKATDEDFENYDEVFLEALNLYVHRRNNNEL